MTITTLPPSPAGEISHNEVREKINETIGVVNGTDLTGRVVVNSAADLSGVLDPTKEYFINGVIDMGSTQITVPVEGLSLTGYNLEISGLTSSEPNYTMFISESAVIGSGNLLGKDYFISVTGAGSKAYELYDATGNNAFEFVRINYINCTSLGDIYDYRQGLEAGSGRFGGAPTLTLHGLWAGGYRITTSIVRNLSGTMTEPLFKAGNLFQMNSRFLSDINCDLPSLAPLHDFSNAEFPNPGTFQLKGCEITRDGAYNADDSNLTPNMSSSDLSAYWKGNNGIGNTFVGGTTLVTSEELTVIGAGSTWYVIEGIFTGTGLQHFSASADGKLTHNGNSPREFEITSNLTIESTPNNELEVRFRKWDDSAGSFINLDYTAQARQVNSFVGGRDVAFFNINTGVTLDQDDYLEMQVRNNSGNNNATLESGSFFRVQER
ncbi:MAG: hypothetical protein Unbinned706contig1000_10 [Prokaryotic dsDNA virus sp.]|nr:MAG: hypothetical protein Unbinned706contig1000_10 [Prokaryotic dsDNA virus sp.]|tara:strand:+ start:13247 stop:14554 length:1308 start_codon:yes stop_codon:yes gene_type:complete